MTDREDHELKAWNAQMEKGFSLYLSRRKFLYASAGAVALGIAACAGASPAPSSGVTRGGTLHLGMTDVSTTEKLDPALSFTTNDAVYCGAIFESLVSTDEHWNVTPLLAKSWKSNTDGSQWTFTLRDDVKFSDGTALSSADVVYSFRRLLDKKLGSSMYARLQPSVDPDGITAVDDHTVSLRLKRPDALMPVALGLRGAKIVKKGTSEFTLSTAIGTGPFKLTSWNAGQGWSVVKNPSYWQPGLPYLDGIQAVALPDQSTKLQSVTSGTNDVGDAINLSSIDQAKAKSTVLMLQNRQCWVFPMDQTKAPFSDIRVVTALKLAQDRTKILNAAFQGYGSITADVPVPTDDPYFPTGLSTTQDIAKAKQLLAQAGFPNGIDIELNTSAAAAGMVEVATAFQQVVKPAGFNVTLKQWPPSSYWDKAWLATPFFQDYWNHRHPVDMLALFYASNAAWNESSHKDPQMDSMIQEAMATPDPAAQRVVVKKALQRSAETFGVAIPVWTPTAWIAKKTVNGLELNFTDYASFKKAYLSK